ncbi:hypothetical protein [Gordonia rubripertincta]|uniref:hypothetical protein n=1 Tax=Gordonia rubripertincta TaxID=36822 RepID=UPI000B8D7133|nr:hypothetical protein [Gordonia rubripertincta]ASR05584.1 hypothetical protein GCWB2_24065 [Gordonia rubripertincta]
MVSSNGALAAPFLKGPLSDLRRFDVPASALPRRDGAILVERPDIPPEDVSTANGLTVATEWVGRVAAVMAVVLFALVMIAIHKGLEVQDSARTVVTNFHTANEYFDERADLTAPATARKQLEELQGVLAALNKQTAIDVEHLGRLLPDMRDLLAAGRGDTRIAKELQGIATTLQRSAASLQTVAGNADQTVSSVDGQLDQAVSLVRQLNNELARTTRKLAPIPPQDGLIPPPPPAGGN